MALVRLTKYRTSPPQFAQVDTDATVGAMVGVNLLGPDGKLVRWDQIANAAETPAALNTTDDLQEGQWNLWFTPLRAQDAVGAILADSANVTLRYVAGTSIKADLTDTAITAGGTLKKRSFDAKGRLSAESAATTTDLAEGTNLYYTDARADARIPPSYIDGLQLQWVSGTALTVTSGAAYIQSSAKVLRAPSAIAKTSLSLAASTWYHVYLYSNAGTPDVEIVTTAPAVAYNGTARSKTGDTSRRYVGSVKTDASGAVLNFLHSPSAGYVGWRNNQGNPPFRVLANGVATSETTVAVGGATPVTARFVFIRLINTATGGVNPQLYTGVSDDSAAGPPTDGIVTVDMGKDAYVTHPMDSAQAMTYWYRTAPTGGAYIDVYGYTYER